MNGRIAVEVGEDNKVEIYVKNIEPYDSIRLLIATALALLEGKADVRFNDGSPLTEEEEQEILSSLTESESYQNEGQRDN